MNRRLCHRPVSVLGALLVVCTCALAQTTERVSVGSGGTQANGLSIVPSTSTDGRFVAFISAASNLVAADVNGVQDAFVRDRIAGTTERVSVSSSGAEATAATYGVWISGRGRFLVLDSQAPNLVAGDNNNARDVFVRDRQLGTTVRVSAAPGGVDGNGISFGGAISIDGRFVAFFSSSSNLVAGDSNQTWDVFVRDLATGTTERVSVDSNGVQGDGGSRAGTLSNDGRFVSFQSVATNLVAGDLNQQEDVFVHDRLLGTTERMSVPVGIGESNGISNEATISGDGRCVAFTSAASNLVGGDSNAAWDVFLRDRVAGTTERISLDSSGAGSNDYCWGPSISSDARFVAFMGAGTNLVAGDTNASRDVFVRDRALGTTERASLGPVGAQGNATSEYPALSRDGRFLAFQSLASNLVAGDTNVVYDIFGRDWTGAPGVDLCQPGTGGVAGCPCANPPGGAPRGCDNSAATGGAQLSSRGSASLALDSLTLSTNGEKPTATSVVLQGTAEVVGGLAFGQGVRCAGGMLKRLYVQSASGGSILVPGPGDPPVSARSAALGDALAPGTSRWYAVYYRDPIVSGGCPAASTYNITQTQLILWGL